MLLDARTPIDLSFLDPEGLFQYHLSPVSSFPIFAQQKIGSGFLGEEFDMSSKFKEIREYEIDGTKDLQL